MNYKNPLFWVLTLSVLIVSLAVPATSYGQHIDDSLDGALLGRYNNDVERRAAISNQSAFNELDLLCNPNNDLDGVANPPAPGQGADASCGGDVFDVYLTIREIVHTANEILQNGGPVAASLGLDLEGLGTTLRWTAAEELAAQGSAATEFTNSQLSNLASRLNALRFGATGFTVAGFYAPGADDGTLVAARQGEPRGGGASADSTSTDYSPWGGFLNGSFGWGRKDDTALENAFDYDGAEISLGIDYRFKNNFVLGLMGGYKRQDLEFDRAASVIRVTDGGMAIDGSAVIAFGLFQGERFYASGSVGYEKMDFEIERRIKYGSNNPEIGSANSIAFSRPKADVVMATFSVGYGFNANRFGFEPYVNAEYRDVEIAAFDEERSIEASNRQEDEDRFELTIAEQKFDALDLVVGARMQYTFTPEFGVIVPFAKVEYHNELLRKAREIRAGYGALTDIRQGTGVLTFSVPTDNVDVEYYTWSVGLSMVLRGGRQETIDGPVSGGLMGFVQYESVEELRNYKEQIVSAGIRYEF